MSSAKASNNGVANSSALWLCAAYQPIWLAAIPLTGWLAQPGGLVEKAVNGLVRGVIYAGTAGASSTVPAGRAILTLGFIHAFIAYPFGASLSASAIAASSPSGRDNDAPRAQVAALTELPLRMHSAASHLQETFPAWAVAAGFALVVAPTNQHIINLLGMAVLSKIFVYIPCYIAKLSVLRGTAHIIYLGSCLSVGWKLARGAI